MLFIVDKRFRRRLCFSGFGIYSVEYWS